MAMVTCYECGKKISSTAPSCPHCGAAGSTFDQKQAENERAAGCNSTLTMLFFCLAIGCFLGWLEVGC